MLLFQSLQINVVSKQAVFYAQEDLKLGWKNRDILDLFMPCLDEFKLATSSGWIILHRFVSDE